MRFIYCYAECRDDECHYAECCYAECRYAECRGVLNASIKCEYPVHACTMRLCQPPDGSTSPKYKLLHF